MKSWRKNFKKAFTIVELLIVGAIFAAAIGSFFGAASISFRAVSKASDKVQAAFLLEEGLEGVRHLRDLSWTHYLASEELGYERCLYFDNANYNFATTTPELIGQWHLDDVANSTSWVSAAPFNNSGTCTAGTTCPASTVVGAKTIPSNFRTAPVFDGNEGGGGAAADGIWINNPPTFGTSFSISLWVKPTTLAVNDNFIGGWNMTGWLFRSGAVNSARLEFNDGATPYVTLSDVLVANVWQHIAVTYNLSGDLKYRLYHNGVEVYIQPGTTVSVPTYKNPITIGRLPGNGPFATTGSVDEVMFFNRALKPIEIMDLYGGHNVCPLVVSTDDNSTTFTRTVKFENICRATNGDAVAPPGDVTLLTTAGAVCPGGTVDTKTKKATISVFWGIQRESLEKVEMYIANLFLN